MYSFTADDPRYLEANAGCKHFDVHGGPENIPVSRFSFDAKVWTAIIHYKLRSISTGTYIEIYPHKQDLVPTFIEEILYS